MSNPNANYDQENVGHAERVSEKDDKLFNRPYDKLDAEQVAADAVKATQSGDKEPGINQEAKE